MHTLKGKIDLATAFEASPNPYMLLTPDLRYAAMNRAYLSLVDADRADLVGRPLFEAFDAGPGADAPTNVRQLRGSLEKVVSTGESDHLARIRYAIPKKLPDGRTIFEDRTWSATHVPIYNDAGHLAYILQHTTDITELELLRERANASRPSTPIDAIVGAGIVQRAERVQRDNLRLEDERARLIDIFMQAPGFVAVLSGPHHKFQLFNAAFHRLVNGRDLTDKTVAEALPEVRDQGYLDLLDRAFRTALPVEGKASRLQLPRFPGGPLEERFVDFVHQPVRDDDGRSVGIIVQGYDVTDNVLAVERQRLMIDELNHRVKNTLATVQSIAMQTARSHDDPATFAQAFQARLLALSHTHDLLTRSHWEGAELHDVLAHETEAHGQTRVVLNGPSVSLDPAAALSLGMVFHELATNAAKYGALSNADGRIFVDWTLGADAERTLRLTWTERGGPTVDPSGRRGFGSRLIARNIRHDLAGEVTVNYVSDGAVAEIMVPLDRGRTH